MESLLCFSSDISILKDEVYIKRNKEKEQRYDFKIDLFNLSEGKIIINIINIYMLKRINK